MFQERLFSGVLRNAVVKSSAAILLATLIISAFAIPASASTGEVLYTSGHVENYYYECTYTPTQEKKTGHAYDGYHSYYVNGYHVECHYTMVHPPKEHHYPKPTPEPTPKHYDSYTPPPKQHYTPDYSCTYRVHKGDTLTHIARYYGVSVYDLAHVNHIKNPNYIRKGQVLYVPCHY